MSEGFFIATPDFLCYIPGVMLYTKKGDDGSTILFDAKKRIPKASLIVDVLGVVDELNSLLGVCKVKADDKVVREMLEDLQQELFVAQAELAGAEPRITTSDVTKLEVRIGKIEKKLPVIKSFFIAGGTELSALLDFARAVSRRVERAAVRLYDDGAMNKDLYSFLNRISSFLYALARLTNQKSGIKEVRPHY